LYLKIGGVAVTEETEATELTTEERGQRRTNGEDEKLGRAARGEPCPGMS
jgi:hypothetical protein